MKSSQKSTYVYLPLMAQKVLTDKTRKTEKATLITLTIVPSYILYEGTFVLTKSLNS